MLPKLTSELESVFNILSCLSTALISNLPAYRSQSKKNPPKPNAAKSASNSGANSKARAPQSKSGSVGTIKGPASTGGGETRMEVESGAEPKGEEEEAFSEADVPDEDSNEDGDQDVDEDEGVDGEEEDAGDASQSPP